MSDAVEKCEKCGFIGALIRIPSMPISVKVKEERKVGDLVKKFIEESREELQQQKQELEENK